MENNEMQGLSKFNEFSEKLISLNLKKRRSSSNNNNNNIFGGGGASLTTTTTGGGGGGNNVQYKDEFDILASPIDNNVNTSNNNVNVVQSLEKSQNDLVNLLEQLKTQNKVIKQSYKTNKHSKKPPSPISTPSSLQDPTKPQITDISPDNGSPNIISFPLNGKDIISFRNDSLSKPTTPLTDVVVHQHETVNTTINTELEMLRKDNEAKERKLREQEAKIKMFEEQQQQKEYTEQLQQKERMDAIEKELRLKIEKEHNERVEREQKEEKVEKERQMKELEMKLKKEMDEKERVVRLLQEKEKYEKEMIVKQQEEERLKKEMEEKMKEEKERREMELRIQIENEVKQKLQSELVNSGGDMVNNGEKKVQKVQMQNEEDDNKVNDVGADDDDDDKVNNENDKENEMLKSNSIAFEIEDIEEIKDLSSKNQSRVSSQLPSIRNNADHKREIDNNNNNNNNEQEEQQQQQNIQHNTNTNTNIINTNNTNSNDIVINTNQTIQNEINTFLPSQNTSPINNNNTNNISLSNDDEPYINPKTKEIEKIKAQREREKAELLKKTENPSNNHPPSSSRSNPSPTLNNPTQYTQQEDVTKILAAVSKKEINLTINKSQFTQITKIDVKEKPYMQGSTEPPSNFLFQRRRKALTNQRYFTEYILKEKNIIETVKKITQNYQDLLEESLKQFEQEKPFSSIFNVVLGHDNNFKEEISAKLNIPSIINNVNNAHHEQQQQTFRSSNPKQQPLNELIGPIQNITTFAMVYSLSTKDTHILKDIISSFTFWRKIKTDGNSFYRTFMFALLEYYIFIKNIHEIQKVILGVMRLADDDILSNGQNTIDFKEVLGIFYFIYDQLSKGNYYQAYLILLNAYKLDNNAFDNAMNLYCKYAIYCIVEHLYNVYLRPQGNNINIMNDGRMTTASVGANVGQDQFNTVDKVNPSLIMKFYYEPMKLVFSVIPFIFNVNLEIIALDGALSKQGNNITVVNTKFTDYSLNDLPVISIGYFLSSYHKIYTREYQHKVLGSFINDIFNEHTVMPLTRGVYIDPKGEEYSCDKCGVTSTLIYFPKQQLSICSQCFLRDIELILKVRASDFNREKCNNIECK